MIACLIEGTRKAIFKPDLFLFRLTEAMHKYNDLVPKSQRGQTVLAIRFTNQTTSDKISETRTRSPSSFSCLVRYNLHGLQQCKRGLEDQMGRAASSRIKTNDVPSTQ